MRHRNILIIFLAVLTFSSCREEEDCMLNPTDLLTAAESDTGMTGKFNVVWNAINTGYAFWDVTDVDWDQRYREYKPLFVELDQQIDTMEITSLDTITALGKTLFQGLLSGLKDHHMVVWIKVLDDYKIKIWPSDAETQSRSYYHTAGQTEFVTTFLPEIEEDPHVKDYQTCRFTFPDVDPAGHTTFVYHLDNGMIIPYLWNASFMDKSSVDKLIAQYLRDPFYQEDVANALMWDSIYNAYAELVVNTPKDKLAGVILDLRTNGGGAMAALPNYVNLFAGEEKTYWETRYKEGMGRYDMSAWIPFRIGMPEKHRDLGAEGIPVVVLCDINSVSCAEITTGSIKQMPTGYVIGERSRGGHGPLSGDTDALYNVTYGGVIGDASLSKGYFIYTSNYENRPVGQPCLEGIGITPDEEVLYNDKGYRGQFDAAIQYIKCYNGIN